MTLDALSTLEKEPGLIQEGPGEDEALTYHVKMQLLPRAKKVSSEETKADELGRKNQNCNCFI